MKIAPRVRQLRPSMARVRDNPSWRCSCDYCQPDDIKIKLIVATLAAGQRLALSIGLVPA